MTSSGRVQSLAVLMRGGAGFYGSAGQGALGMESGGESEVAARLRGVVYGIHSASFSP